MVTIDCPPQILVVSDNQKGLISNADCDLVGPSLINLDVLIKSIREDPVPTYCELVSPSLLNLNVVIKFTAVGTQSYVMRSAKSISIKS